MTRDQLEFQISQYADGTLSSDETAALDEIFARDADARAMLAEYRRLDAMLKREMPLPAMAWDKLAAGLSEAVAHEEIPTRTLRIWTTRTWTRVAMAAVVLLAVGTTLLWHLRPASNNTVVVNPPTAVENDQPTALVSVTGPASEAGAGAPVAVVEIGPSPLAQRQNSRLAETIVYRPPRVVIASGQSNRQDTQRLPY